MPGDYNHPAPAAPARPAGGRFSGPAEGKVRSGHLPGLFSPGTTAELPGRWFSAGNITPAA